MGREVRASSGTIASRAPEGMVVTRVARGDVADKSLKASVATTLLAVAAGIEVAAGGRLLFQVTIPAMGIMSARKATRGAESETR